MALVDFEAAWLDLVEVIESRPDGWGTRNLLAEMQKVTARHQIPEAQVERLLRLYGNQISIVMSTPEGEASGPGGSTPSGAEPSPRATEDRGGRDGSSNAREAVPA